MPLHSFNNSYYGEKAVVSDPKDLLNDPVENFYRGSMLDLCDTVCYKKRELKALKLVIISWGASDTTIHSLEVILHI